MIFLKLILPYYARIAVKEALGQIMLKHLTAKVQFRTSTYETNETGSNASLITIIVVTSLVILGSSSSSINIHRPNTLFTQIYIHYLYSASKGNSLQFYLQRSLKFRTMVQKSS